MSLGTDHSWGWLWDIRNLRVESLIKVHYPLFDEQLRHCRLHWFCSSIFILYSFYCTQIILSFIFFYSSNSILIVLKVMIMKDMITACVADFLLFALFSFIGLFRRYMSKLPVIIYVELAWFSYHLLVQQC
jgi:hypothetical protein